MEVGGQGGSPGQEADAVVVAAVAEQAQHPLPEAGEVPGGLLELEGWAAAGGGWDGTGGLGGGEWGMSTANRTACLPPGNTYRFLPSPLHIAGHNRRPILSILPALLKRMCVMERHTLHGGHGSLVPPGFRQLNKN